MVPKIDINMLDTDLRFSDYCSVNNIKDPLRARFDEKQGDRDEYLRLSHAFRLWDFHFWMDWEKFQWHCKYDKNYTDVSIYMPCDTVERQCSMECRYFGKECPRKHEELKAPKILGFEGRWEYHDDDWNY